MGNLATAGLLADIVFALTKLPKFIQLLSAEKRLRAFGTGIRKALAAMNLLESSESCVKVDARGVHFFSETKNAMDMLELENDECAQLISELRISGIYEYIILDVDFMVGKDMLALYRKTDRLIMVGDGSDISNGKLVRELYSKKISNFRFKNQKLLTG